MSAHDTCPASIISRLRTRSMPRRTSIRQRAWALVVVLTLRSSQGFVTPTYSRPAANCSARSRRHTQIFREVHWICRMEHLKFGGSVPTYDVLEKTKEYVAASEATGGLATDYHANDYIFRGSIVGPITATLAKPWPRRRQTSIY